MIPSFYSPTPRSAGSRPTLIMGARSRCESSRATSHRDWIWCVAASPDGKGFATAGGDGVAWISALDSARRISLFGHQGSVLAVVYSPDGEFLFTGGSDGTIRMWISDTGEICRTVRTGHVPIRTTAFHP